MPADFDFAQLARLTPGYVGADLMALCREAAMTAVNRVLLQQLEAGHMCQNTDVQNDDSAKSQDMSISSDVVEESGQASDDLSAPVIVLIQI